MRLLKIILPVCSFFQFADAAAQVTFPINGIPDKRHIVHAFTNARIFTDSRTVTDSATLVILDGKILAVGRNVTIPADAVIHDLNHKVIYPSFIDADTRYGVAENTPYEKPKGPQIETTTKGAYSWNQALKPEYRADEAFVPDDAAASKYRNGGFGTVLTFNHDGIARGTASIVSLASTSGQETILKGQAAACYSLNKGTSHQDYPTSQMGAIALLRQSFLDADWYENGGETKEFNLSIQSWINNRKLVQYFESTDELQSLRIAQLGKEFGINYLVRGSGDEYKRIAEIKNTGCAFVIPLNFPMGYDVKDPFDAINVTLEQLKEWETAPANAWYLDSAGVRFAFTASGLKDPSEFIDMLRKAVQYGLSSVTALKACTEIPAGMLGIDNLTGTLAAGKLANFIITSGDLFKKNTKILENWVTGNGYMINESIQQPVRGVYNLVINQSQYTLKIGGNDFDLKGAVINGADTINAALSYQNSLLAINFDLKSGNAKGKYSLSGYFTDPVYNTLAGTGSLSGGNGFSWRATRLAPFDGVLPPDTATIEKPQWGSILYPAKAYGFTRMPVSENAIIRNITVWTNEKEGVIQNCDVYISGGKIMKIGKGLVVNGASEIDGTGKHLTAGIIDEHSHIAVSGDVNECSHAITSEVRIGDVINSDDINIYRQLSGGVTTSHLLHGSCNPIGGQTALIKLRWGMPPEKMKFENADGFIKFALGENVKQSNWGDEFRLRYPQTRMGVEQVYYNAFTEAKAYEREWKAYNARPAKAVKPRKNLRLDALVEILNKQRFITCHSYEQGEINMLMHVADSMGFRVNTFTHILEGYKVADKMKKHGAGGSSFSDWWAYKYEVMEAIPYNGALMHDEGVVVAYNSDDPEMARRLNQEAAKAIKYGGVSEEEALKFVTLNPAKLLHIDNRVGSIKEGKDADLVIWNDHPLSVYAKVLMTFVDGTRYYDVIRDAALQKEIAAERDRIITKMINENAKAKPGDIQKTFYHNEVIKHCLGDEE